VVFHRWCSINESQVDITRLNKYPVLKQSRNYESEISPRVSIVKRIGSDFSLFGSIAKGFSPPTTAELLPSTGVISTSLEAEEGTNYELGSRLNLLGGKLQMELIAFHFKLNNALVLRKDSSNADYYVNAGDAQQKGIELSIDYLTSFKNSRLFDQLVIRTAQSFNDFTYGDFQKDATNYSGKKLPSVPDYAISVLADLKFKAGVYLSGTYYHASSIFLNDANTVEAKAYDLLVAGSAGGLISTTSSSIYI
jgi:iron complex outermembrane receptor protein